MRQFLLLTLLFFSACSPTIIQQNDNPPNGKYDSSFPTQDAAPTLKSILRSVKLVSANAFYESYSFAQSAKMTMPQFRENLKNETVGNSEIFSKIGTGAATVLSGDDRRVMLISCAHIVDPPDTLFNWYLDATGRELPFLRSVAIKSRQTISIPDMPQVNGYRILASDRKIDLSLIGLEFNRAAKNSVPVLSVPPGNAGELEWGSFVYLIAIPRNLKMVTRALVSNPQLSVDNDFLLDSNLQKGVSGGIVFALRDGVRGFEWVGITDAIASKTDAFLVPSPDSVLSEISTADIYRGDIYIQQKQSTFYGMVHSISINTILAFIENHAEAIKQNGFARPLILPD